MYISVSSSNRCHTSPKVSYLPSLGMIGHSTIVSLGGLVLGLKLLPVVPHDAISRLTIIIDIVCDNFTLYFLRDRFPACEILLQIFLELA